LRDAGKQVLLVTSGAVGRGLRMLGMKRRPTRLADIQALAAIGQSELMSLYATESRRHGFAVAQLLLTADDLRKRERYLNVMNCIHSLWEKDVLPVVNENDSVSVDELKFSDNDALAGMLASLTDAGLTMLLTTENGLRDRNPDGSLGNRISIVRDLSEDIMALAGSTDNSTFSIGGMKSKLMAADMVTSAGKYLWIADGRKSDVFDSILAADDIGTLFVPKAHHIGSRKRWLAFFSKVSGRIIVDEGAAAALIEHGGSLLPSGAVGVSGSFKRGDAVEIADMKGHVIARGLVNFSAGECALICGRKSSDIRRALGNDCDVEMIHRDHLCITE
ncbi:MAG: glutamate 5-kinase, partial [Victivallaceae bacterium]|nr:glutamate 5-kinase [Victivallaceae bacterium]